MLDYLSYNRHCITSSHSKICCHSISWSDHFYSQEGTKIMPNLFCHQCKAYSCLHSPCIDSSGKFFFPFSVIGKPPNAPLPPVLVQRQKRDKALGKCEVS